jgi:hypothetical protein
MLSLYNFSNTQSFEEKKLFVFKINEKILTNILSADATIGLSITIFNGEEETLSSTDFSFIND